MNRELLHEHVARYLAKLENSPKVYESDLVERHERSTFYRSWNAERMGQMTADDFFEYLSKLWAMRIWGNKQYVVDKLLADHGISNVRKALAALVWSQSSVEKRWDAFRSEIKGIGPAMMSEILCHVHPDKFMLWNRRAYVALNYLGVPDLPRYNYQLDGAKYRELCAAASAIAQEMTALGDKDANLLKVDYFLWEELQVEETLAQIHKPTSAIPTLTPVEKADAATAEFIHNEVRDKIADIGRWLGLQADTEVKVADGAVVDAIWQATIGNMGRVIYVFEVQTKGSIDGLILNLLRSLNNPAVQGVVAVSDATQLDKIKIETASVAGLKDKLKYWNYVQVLDVHESLESVNDAINSLGLVPQAF
jgi:hypothetical protein